MKLINTAIFCLIVLFTVSCSDKQEKPDYEAIVQNELEKGVRNDSLFLGYELGMEQEEFFEYSWDLNKKELVKQGHQNMTVVYQLDDNELPHPATMNFYPDFKDDKIFRMRTTFAYKGWAPWNKHLGADSLIHDVKDLMVKWYGNGFIKFEDPEVGLIYKKVDGNREIVITKARDDIEVNVKFTDLTAVNLSARNKSKP